MPGLKYLYFFRCISCGSVYKMRQLQKTAEDPLGFEHFYCPNKDCVIPEEGMVFEIKLKMEEIK